MIAGPWKSRAEFESWWKVNVVEFNRLAVRDPQEWRRVAAIVDKFQQENPQ